MMKCAISEGTTIIQPINLIMFKMEATKETKRKLNQEKKRIGELNTIIKKLYESFAIGRITHEHFDTLIAGCALPQNGY